MSHRIAALKKRPFSIPSFSLPSSSLCSYPSNIAIITLVVAVVIVVLLAAIEAVNVAHLADNKVGNK